MGGKILAKVELIEQQQGTIMSDITKLKAVLIKRTDEDDRHELFEAQKFDEPEAFEEFSQRLTEEKNFRDLFVSTCTCE